VSQSLSTVHVLSHELRQIPEPFSPVATPPSVFAPLLPEQPANQARATPTTRMATTHFPIVIKSSPFSAEQFRGKAALYP